MKKQIINGLTSVAMFLKDTKLFKSVSSAITQNLTDRLQSALKEKHKLQLQNTELREKLEDLQGLLLSISDTIESRITQ